MSNFAKEFLQLQHSLRESMNEFEDKLHEDLHQFLLSMKEVDERLRHHYICTVFETKFNNIDR